MTSHENVRYGSHGSSLRDLPRLRASRRRRASSWDRTGGNYDLRTLQPGETLELAQIVGAGSINHMWFTTKLRNEDRYNDDEPDYLRKLVLQMFWDGEENPSVLVPLGDFFGSVPPTSHEFVSHPLRVGPSNGRSLTSFWHMPFSDGAQIALINESSRHPIDVYFYIDYEEFDELEEGIGRFHAQWHRESHQSESEEGRTNLRHTQIAREPHRQRSNYDSAMLISWTLRRLRFEHPEPPRVAPVELVRGGR